MQPTHENLHTRGQSDGLTTPTHIPNLHYKSNHRSHSINPHFKRNASNVENNLLKGGVKDRV